MSTPTTDVPEATAAEAPALQESTAPDAKTPANIPTTCFLCTKAIKHAEVVLLGHSDTDADIAVHPNCLMPGVNDHIKDLRLIHVHIEKGKAISLAKQIVVKKNIKAIYKAIALANHRKQAKKASA